jgi:hypothetical protein
VDECSRQGEFYDAEIHRPQLDVGRGLDVGELAGQRIVAAREAEGAELGVERNRDRTKR